MSPQLWAKTFSQQGALQHLHTWVDEAQARLDEGLRGTAASRGTPGGTAASRAELSQLLEACRVKIIPD